MFSGRFVDAREALELGATRPVECWAGVTAHSPGETLENLLDCGPRKWIELLHPQYQNLIGSPFLALLEQVVDHPS